MPIPPFPSLFPEDLKLIREELRKISLKELRAYGLKVNSLWGLGENIYSWKKVMGNIPIMLCSKACNLGGLSPADLVKRGEHEQEQFSWQNKIIFDVKIALIFDLAPTFCVLA